MYELEIQDLIDDGILSPDDVEDFENLDPETREMIANGELDMDDVTGV